MSDGRIDFYRLAGDALLARGRKRLERLHVVITICELDEDDPNIPGHREEHLAEAFSLLMFLGGKLDPIELGYPVHDIGDRIAETFGQDLLGDRGVLDHVVQQRRHERVGIKPPAGEDLGDGDRMRDIGLAAAAKLSEMRLVAEAIGFTDAALVVFTEVFACALHQRGQRYNLALVGDARKPFLDQCVFGRVDPAGCRPRILARDFEAVVPADIGLAIRAGLLANPRSGFASRRRCGASGRDWHSGGGCLASHSR